MDNPPSIEERLRQLMPPSVSEAGQMKFEDTIDQLAGVTPEESLKKDRKHWWEGKGKAAAAVALLAVPVVMYQVNSSSSPNPLLVMNEASDAAALSSELRVLKTTYKINGREDDGLIIPADGAAPHYRYRYSITDEEQVRDVETGAVITLRQPRQEVVTIPVTQF